MNVLKNCNIVLAQKQPKKLLHLLSKARFNTNTNNLIQPKLLFTCTDKPCKYWKNGWNNVVGFESRIDQENTDYRRGICTCKFPIQVYIVQ